MYDYHNRNRPPHRDKLGDNVPSDTGLGVLTAMTCNQCDCRFRPIEGNLCSCECHLCTGDHSTKG